MKLSECKTCRKCCDFAVKRKIDKYMIPWWGKEKVVCSGLPRKTFVKLDKKDGIEAPGWFRLNFRKQCPFLGKDGCSGRWKGRECELFPLWATVDGLYLFKDCPASSRIYDDIMRNVEVWAEWWFVQKKTWEDKILLKNLIAVELAETAFVRVI